MSENKRLDMHSGDLSDRQSVRTTLRFSKEALEALGWLSQRYGVSIKDVLHSALEQLIEQGPGEGEITRESESTKGQRERNELSTNLGIGVILSKPDNGKEDKNTPEKTVRRTVVVTKKTLKNLNKISKEHKINRDDLINEAIICTKSFTDIVDKSQTKNYQEAFYLIDELYSEAQAAKSKLKEILGDDEGDPIIESMGLAVTMIMNTSMQIEDELKKRNND